MLKVLLAENEYADIEFLESQVPWEELGFQVVASAVDGQQALLEADEHHPDLLITEVNLPVLDGISMAQHLRQNHPRIHIIFLHNQAQIEHLKAAMHIGADDYLLKPVEMDELTDLLQRIHTKCSAETKREQQQKSMLCASMAQYLSGSSWQPPEQIAWLLSSFFNLSVHEKTRYYITEAFLDEIRYITQNEDLLDFTMADVANEIRRISEYLPSMMVEISPQRFALISTVHPKSGLLLWHAQPVDEHAFITVLYDGTPVLPEAIRGKLTELYVLHNNLVLARGSGRLHTPIEAERLIAELPYERTVSSSIDPLIKHLIAGNDHAAQKWLNDFFETHTSHNIHLLTIELLDRIDRQLQLLPIPISFSSKRKVLLIKRLLDLESATMLHQMMQTYLQDMMALIEPGDHNFKDRIVRDTMQYIKAHYDQPFTIDELAEEMHYSPNHLRYVFKKVTGRTLSEEITNTRLEQARRMLRDTPMRVHQISKQVGYTNPSYFISQFLKKYGMTPIQYRNRKTS